MLGYYAIAQGTPAREADDLDLDEVQPGLAGGLRWRQLQADAESLGVGFMADATRWLWNDQLYALAAQKNRGPPPEKTSEKYKKHLKALVEYRVCHTGPSDGSATCRYFAVPKNAQVARSILDCSRMSDPVRSDVGPVNLASIPDILRRMQENLGGAETPAIYLSDLRHFFHQLALDPSVRIYFLVRLPGCGTYVWLVLPMGHTASPKVAQAIAHGLLAVAIGRKGCSYPALPHYQFIPGGIATIFYDNLIAAGADHAMNKLKQTWETKCEKYHAITKYSRFYSRAKLGMNDHAPDREETLAPVMLGLRLAVIREGGKNVLHFRHAAANVLRWKELLDESRTPRTLRELARLAGVCSFDRYVRTATEASPGPPDGVLIDVLRRIGRTIFAKEKATTAPRSVCWDMAIGGEAWASDIKNLRRRLADICVNQWGRVRPHPPADALVATDSSGTHGGGVLLSPDADATAIEAIPTHSFAWGPEDKKLHITAREAWAIVRVLEHFGPQLRGRSVRVGCDAMVVVGAVRKGLSTSVEMQRALGQLRSVTTEFQMTLTVVWLPGTENYADFPTRPTARVTDDEKRRRLATTLRRLSDVAPFSEPDFHSAEELFETCEAERREIDGASVEE